MVSDRQKKLKRNKTIFCLLSYGTLFILLIIGIIKGASNFNAVEDGVEIFTEQAKKIFISMSVTAIIGTIATFFLKEGMRHFLWVVIVILWSVLFKSTGMYIALGCWLLDDYVFFKLYQHFKLKLSIRKEIDLD